MSDVDQELEQLVRDHIDRMQQISQQEQQTTQEAAMELMAYAGKPWLRSENLVHEYALQVIRNRKEREALVVK